MSRSADVIRPPLTQGALLIPNLDRSAFTGGIPTGNAQWWLLNTDSHVLTPSKKGKKKKKASAAELITQHTALFHLHACTHTHTDAYTNPRAGITGLQCKSFCYVYVVLTASGSMSLLRAKRHPLPNSRRVLSQVRWQRCVSVPSSSLQV